MHIQMIQEDIDHGVPRNYHKCPVANAISRVMNEHNVAVLFWSEIGRGIIWAGGRPFIMPQHVKKVIHAFDSDLPIEPVSFELVEL